MTSSPKFKNLGCRPKQSPIELKEKMRKSYRNKIQNRRGMLLDKLRGPIIGIDLCSTLSDFYKDMFNFSDEFINDEEYEVLEELKNELVQEELEWYLKEYEKYQLEHVDWSSVEEDNNIICPVCKKTNFQLTNSHLNCPNCKSSIKTQKSLSEIKNIIFSSVDSHNATCDSDAQFAIVSEVNDSHIYFICSTCSDMKLIV